MTVLSDADRLFLASDYRWVEVADDTIKAKHPGAREAEYISCFVAVDGANAAIAIINAMTCVDRRLAIVLCDGILDVNFAGRPRTVRLLTKRFGYDLTTGRKMLVERADKDHGADTTTLYLTG